MKKTRGCFIHNGVIIADNVEISLVHIEPSSSSLGEWYGTYMAHGLFGLDECFLELEDGRKGKVIITSNTEFRGTGPLS
jgi:hypothetical protein